MRFLFVFQDHAVSARELVAELGVADTTVLFVRKGEVDPSREYLSLLAECGGTAATAVVGVHRKYVKALEGACRVDLVVKAFRREDLVLRSWLVPPSGTSLFGEASAPSEAFASAARSEPRLLIARGALDRADEITALRYPFAHRAAVGLAAYAATGGQVGGRLDAWFQTNYRVSFAVNGQVSFAYEAVSADTVVHDGSGKSAAPRSGKSAVSRKGGEG